MKNSAESRQGYCDIKTSYLTFGNIVSNMLVISLKKANSYYDAMEARCFDGELIFLEEDKKIETIQIVSAFALIFSAAPTANAMHIMKGYLPPKFCIFGGVICIPFLAAGYLSIKRTLAMSRKSIVILAIAGAFVFVISSLKIPSITGSCSHMTGTGLGAILFGSSAVSILGIIVLVFQAILLAHGGITTLGANTFSIAIAGPLFSYGIYRLCQKLKVNKNVGIFLAALIAIIPLFTLRGAEFGGSDDAGSKIVSQVTGTLHKPWFKPVMET